VPSLPPRNSDHKHLSNDQLAHRVDAAEHPSGPVHVSTLLPGILIRLALKRAAYNAQQREHGKEVA
jgi:hypothetical protein